MSFMAFFPIAMAAWKENKFESNEFIISKNTNFPLI